MPGGLQVIPPSDAFNLSGLYGCQLPRYKKTIRLKPEAVKQ